jgi:hypothetical protein
MAANVFYLTMTFFYFLVLVMFAVAAPVVFGRLVALRAERPAPSPILGEPIPAAPAAPSQ